ncbi:serine/threonine-protein kinase Nek4-like [Danio aesculapii]|uniref:serine/threonine-protein kinase Nek4-like n=1 Tax=Danio aesculapii TaxID=1142201 RepID=UPI0024BF2E6B|nr:serine/threonine-protein kinase Nek4-like [Danio aesculapii]
MDIRQRLLPSFVSLLKKHGYTVKKEYEPGVSGKVFLVKDRDGDLCILKEINCRDAKILQEVQKEVEILKTLKHGYIASYVESFEDKEAGFFYIVVEYCAGGDLSQRMKTQKCFFEEEQILDWLVQICLALQYIHEKKVLHRDIKPQNLFLTEEGYINIGDFGCSKVLERAEAYAQSVVGADLYVSPEVYEKKYNSKSDIWSFGWLLHDLCMLDIWEDIKKRRLNHALSMTGTVPHISESYSKELRELISQMLSCDPKERPSAEEILTRPFLREAVKRFKRIPERLEQSLKKSINTFVEAYNDNYKDFEVLVKEWGETTDSLEDMHYKATAGSLSGAVIGTAGGVTALAGVALAPVTFGASLLVSAVGAGIGVAGGITGAASNITDSVKQKSYRENLEQIEKKYKSSSEPILNTLNKLREVLGKVYKFSIFERNSHSNNTQPAWEIGKGAADCATGAVSLAMLANVGRIACRSAKIGRIVAAASVVLSGVLVVVDVTFIVKDSKEIYEMRQNWRTDDPDKVSSDVLKSIAQLRKTYKELCKVLEDIKGFKAELNAYSG